MDNLRVAVLDGIGQPLEFGELAWETSPHDSRGLPQAVKHFCGCKHSIIRRRTLKGADDRSLGNPSDLEGVFISRDQNYAEPARLLAPGSKRKM